MHIGGKFNTQFDRFIVWDGAEFQFGHGSIPIGFEDEVARDHHAHWESGANGQGRRDGKLTTNNLLTGAADRVLRSFANGAGDVVVIIGAKLHTDIQDSGEPAMNSRPQWLLTPSSRPA